MLQIITRIHGNRVTSQWFDYFGRSFTFMSAGEEAEKIRGQFGESHRFKVLHEKLVERAA